MSRPGVRRIVPSRPGKLSRKLRNCLAKLRGKGKASRPPLEFGWYFPKRGDTTTYAESPELCDRVVKAPEQAGFEKPLMAVGSVCRDPWITGAFIVARSSRIRPLIAARPGYTSSSVLRLA